MDSNAGRFAKTLSATRVPIDCLLDSLTIDVLAICVKRSVLKNVRCSQNPVKAMMSKVATTVKNRLILTMYLVCVGVFIAVTILSFVDLLYGIYIVLYSGFFIYV
jgi:hypothetical protein